ncbi:MAG TPA: hypothetical protein VFS20_32370 [Longimicrobium sp.]|nr:hypothetical protein [Longimicrobium sp.]
MSNPSEKTDELLPEYDLTTEQLRDGVRGKYAERYAAGTNIVKLDPDVAKVFPDSESVNEALRALIGIMRSRAKDLAA